MRTWEKDCFGREIDLAPWFLERCEAEAAEDEEWWEEGEEDEAGEEAVSGEEERVDEALGWKIWRKIVWTLGNL